MVWLSAPAWLLALKYANMFQIIISIDNFLIEIIDYITNVGPSLWQHFVCFLDQNIFLPGFSCDFNDLSILTPVIYGAQGLIIIILHSSAGNALCQLMHTVKFEEIASYRHGFSVEFLHVVYTNRIPVRYSQYTYISPESEFYKIIANRIINMKKEQEQIK